MKIVHLIMMFQTGGAETMLVDIVNKQVKDGHSVSLIIFNEDLKDSRLLQKMERSIAVRYVNRPVGSHNPWYALKLNYILLSLRPDVVHCHNIAFANVVFAVPLRKIFITAHAIGYNYEAYSRVAKVNKIFAISQMVKDDVDRRYGGKYKNMVVVEDGICLENIKRKTEYKQEKPFKIVMVSRLNLKQKAQDVLLKAVALIEKQASGQIKLDLIGTGDDKTLIQSMIDEYQLGKTVKLLGNQTREYLYSNLWKYDLLVQSSRIEGFGLTVVEGMAAGLPILVSDNGGPMEIIDFGKYGYSFKTGDATDCADKISMISSMQEDELHSIGIRSVERAQNYSLEAMVEKYYYYYKKR